MIEKYKSERKKEVGVASVNREVARLEHLYSKAMEWGRATESPAKKVKWFKGNNRRLRYLSQEETKKLIISCAPHLKPIVLLRFALE